MNTIIKLYHIKSGDREFIYTPKMLIDSAEGNQEVADRLLATLKEQFEVSDAEIEVKSPWTMSDDTNVAAKTIVYDEATGMQKRRPELYDGAFIQNAVVRWTLPYSKDGDGLAHMPVTLGRTVLALVRTECAGGADDPLSLAMRKALPNGS